MRRTHEDLSETHILGANTRQLVVRADTGDPRAWLQSAALCPALARHQIVHVGIMEAAVPYRAVRTRQSGTYLLACFGGEGRILVDGRWKVCKAGTTCLLPAHMLHAFHAVSKSSWQFCWVRYQQPPEQQPVVASASPVLAKFDAIPLHDAILGLYHECHGREGGAGAMHHWVELIQLYVLRFAQPWHIDDRLWHLWDDVMNDLGKNWSVDKLAKQSHISGEHLRRLCHRQLGRSPMQHVTFLRMRHAADLLASTEDKIEIIAGAVGYKNPFVFSNTFKKWIGWRPSEHRLRGMVGE